jgi:hypothetical protein
MPPRRASALPFVLSSFAVLSFGYCGAYLWARATHELVNYGSFIGRPRASAGPGIGYSDWELAFFPLILVESTLRSGT